MSALTNTGTTVRHRVRIGKRVNLGGPARDPGQILYPKQNAGGGPLALFAMAEDKHLTKSGSSVVEWQLRRDIGTEEHVVSLSPLETVPAIQSTRLSLSSLSAGARMDHGVATSPIVQRVPSPYVVDDPGSACRLSVSTFIGRMLTAEGELSAIGGIYGMVIAQPHNITNAPVMQVECTATGELVTLSVVTGAWVLSSGRSGHAVAMGAPGTTPADSSNWQLVRFWYDPGTNRHSLQVGNRSAIVSSAGSIDYGWGTGSEDITSLRFGTNSTSQQCRVATACFAFCDSTAEQRTEIDRWANIHYPGQAGN